jgi:hypothetical protein
MVVDKQKGQNQFRVQTVPKGRQSQGQGRQSQGQGRQSQGQGRQSQGQGRQSQGQGRQDDQAGGKVVQSQAGVKTGRTIKKRIAKGEWEKYAGVTTSADVGPSLCSGGVWRSTSLAF